MTRTSTTHGGTLAFWFVLVPILVAALASILLVGGKFYFGDYFESKRVFDPVLVDSQTATNTLIGQSEWYADGTGNFTEKPDGTGKVVSLEISSVYFDGESREYAHRLKGLKFKFIQLKEFRIQDVPEPLAYWFQPERVD